LCYKYNIDTLKEFYEDYELRLLFAHFYPQMRKAYKGKLQALYVLKKLKGSGEAIDFD